MIKNIVIIDDNDYKRLGVREYLESIFPDANFIECGFINEGLRCIALENYGEIKKNPSEWLVVSDMMMPRREDSMICQDGGFDVLAEMSRRHIKCPVIIVSSEKIDVDKAANLYDNFLGFVKYNMCVYNLSDYENLLTEYMD